MKKLHLSLKNNHSSIKEFSYEEYMEINDFINTRISNSKMKWSFDIICRNYLSLLTSTDNEFRKLSKDQLNWEKLQIATLEINRNLLNYLTSLNTFLDHSNKFLSRKFGKNSNELKEFKQKTFDIFDNNFSYRFLYKLRNFTVHCGYSLCALEIEYNQEQITYIPKFIYKDLMEDSSFWGAKVKADLELIGEDFKAFDLFRESINHYKTLYEYIEQEFMDVEVETKIERIIELLQIDIKDIESYCFLIEENEIVKITEIPIHYLSKNIV